MSNENIKLKKSIKCLELTPIIVSAKIIVRACFPLIKWARLTTPGRGPYGDPRVDTVPRLISIIPTVTTRGITVCATTPIT